MNTRMRHQHRFVLALAVSMLCCATVLRAQPDPDRRAFYRTRIQHNPDATDQLRAIAALRRQLPDTADLVDTRQRHPTRVQRQREALFLNFLCYVHEAQSGGLNACALEQGLKNYTHMVALGPWEGYPSPEEQQQAHAQAKALQRALCRQVFEQNGNRLEGLPTDACGCMAVINEMLTQADEQRRSDDAEAQRQQAERVEHQEAARKDSIGRVEAARNAELSMAIYAPDGTLRSDRTHSIGTTSVDLLNTVMLDAMFTAARNVFVSGAESARNWELLASTVREERPLVWSFKARKQEDRFVMEDISIGDFHSNIGVRLLSELYLTTLRPYVADGEQLVLPFRVVLDPAVTGSNVRLDAADGYVNILLRPIPKVNVDD